MHVQSLSQVPLGSGAGSCEAERGARGNSDRKAADLGAAPREVNVPYVASCGEAECDGNDRVRVTCAAVKAHRAFRGG